MRDPWGFNERLFAFYYPRLLALAENAGQRETRAALISQAEGRTLELGAGSGINLVRYTPKVTELVITEPSPQMVEHLEFELTKERLRCGPAAATSFSNMSTLVRGCSLDASRISWSSRTVT